MRTCRLTPFLTGMAAALALSLVCADGARELVPNGSFETLDSEGGAESWGMRDWGDSKLGSMKVAGGAQSGQRCLQLTATSGPLLYGCFSHPAALGDQPPAEVLLTLYYRTEGTPAPDVAVTSFAEDFSAEEWKTPVIASEARPLVPSPKWRVLTWHVRLLPAARQVTVVARVHGQGALFLDGVSLKPYPAELACQVLAPGLVSSIKGDRECRLRVTNQTDEALPVRVQVDTPTDKGPRGLGGTTARVAAGASDTVTVKYAWPADKSLPVTVTLSDEKGTVIYDRVEVRAPGLIDGRITSPVFRGTILQHVPVAEIAASGNLNATDELRAQLRLDGRVAGLGADLPEIQVNPDGFWQTVFPVGTMLTGSYALQLRASQADRQIAELSLPVLKPEPAPGEAGYDQRLRLYVGPEMRLPLGVFFAVDEADFAAVAEAGFNTLVISSRLASTAAMATAAKLGLTVLISSASTDKESWQTICDKYAPMPNTMGWYILQRPEGQVVPVDPDVIASVGNALTELDPRHPVCLATGSLTRLAEYAPACDILMPWTEPEPVGDLQAVDALLARSVETCSSTRPFWPIVQMTGAAYATDIRLDPEGNGRPPTPEEYRCMAYLAMARGARGLFSFAYRLPRARGQREFLVSNDAPELWKTVRRVNFELRSMAPVLLEGEPIAVQSDCPNVPVLGLRYNDVSYVLAANPNPTPAVLSMTIPGMQGSELEVAFDPRKIIGSAPGVFVDPIEPHGVRVYMGR